MAEATAPTFKIKNYIDLLKLRLSLSVAFSSIFGYLLGIKTSLSLPMLFIFGLSGLMVICASNILNQIFEIETDGLMKRTMNRPLVRHAIHTSEAAILVLVLATTGLSLMLYFFNFQTALLSFISMLLYGYAYTPLKTKNSAAVFVGAIPGALPPMIGWMAATNQYGLEPGILFAIQFVWQFPHFWAIAWVLDDDYKKAGIKLLPSGGKKDLSTALKIMMYTLALIPLSFVPYLLGMTGINSAFIALFCGVLFLAQTFYLMKECSNRAAKLIMFGSFVYLPIVQIAYVWDKIIP